MQMTPTKGPWWNTADTLASKAGAREGVRVQISPDLRSNRLWTNLVGHLLWEQGIVEVQILSA